MLARPKSFTKNLYYFKFLGLILIITGIPAMLLDTSQGSEIPLLVGLFITLITSEKIEDERSLLIKTTSLYIAFVISYGVKLLTTNLYSHNIISFELVEINHFLILVLSMANFIFYGRMFILRF
jgi:predicted Na+-dependent transporter